MLFNLFIVLWLILDLLFVGFQALAPGRLGKGKAGKAGKGKAGRAGRANPVNLSCQVKVI